MKDVLTVDQIGVQSVVSRERDPYGQEGFSALFANILTSDKRKIVFLESARALKSVITVKCGILEIQGRVSKCSEGSQGFEAVIAIDDLKVLKPVRP